MKAIVLAAGYATRLYPLTLNKPKSLLEVAGKTILDRLVEEFCKVAIINEIIIVANARFYPQFLEWANGVAYPKPIRVFNDGTTTNENRLGAIADIAYVIDRAQINEAILVAAGDNIFTFSLADFVNFYEQAGSDVITAHEIKNSEALKKTGVIEVNEQSQVVSFEEKPAQPRSKLAAPPLYIFDEATLPLISVYLKEGNNPDAPGNFIPWLIQRKTVFAYQFIGTRYDIGTPESYQEVNHIFSNKGTD